MVSNETARVFFHLTNRGYRPNLAFRISQTPPLTVARPLDDGSRPGRELAEALARRLPDVVQALLYWERWAPS